ncbi:hypothetical protein OENI_40172 [Oenococcus oeni]|nr:hypothetical protein OENI_40172 [Oenococcus oeni]
MVYYLYISKIFSLTLAGGFIYDKTIRRKNSYCNWCGFWYGQIDYRTIYTRRS